MGNAVWVYMNDKLRADRNFDQFAAWAKRQNVSHVILYFPKAGLDEELPAVPEMAAFIDRCKQEAMEVHGMISAYMSPPRRFFEPGLESNFAVDWHGCSNRSHPAGGSRYFLDPNKPAVMEMLRRVVKNLLATYPELDGVQLDFIRYFHSSSSITIDTVEAGSDLRLLTQPKLRISGEMGEALYFLDRSQIQTYDPPVGGSQRYFHNYHYCFCDKCLVDFRTAYSIPLSLERPRVVVAQELTSKYAQQWYEFRANIISKAVRNVRDEINRMGTGKQLSATFWYNSPYGNRLTNQPFRTGSEYTDFGQRWDEWAFQGLVDFFCPMNYWLEPLEYGEITKAQVEKIHGRLPIYSGVLTSRDYPSPMDTLDQYTAQAEKAGAAGICFFAYHTWAQ